MAIKMDQVHYTVRLDYRAPSAVVVGADTLEGAKRALLKELAFYAQDPQCGYPVQEMDFAITASCNTCSGSGEVPHARQRPTAHRAFTRFKTCPTCGGEGSRGVI